MWLPIQLVGGTMLNILRVVLASFSSSCWSADNTVMASRFNYFVFD
jgi:hypothetical protein